ncbi:MAG: DUF1015 domain-containing protein [Phycisphaeraceae bacterium]
MPQIKPIPTIRFARSFDSKPADISALIAPPYDVLDEERKRAMLGRDGHNIVAIDLPFTPPKVVGPDAVYQRAGETYRAWLKTGVLRQTDRPALFVYQQSYTHRGRKYDRRGVIADVRVQDLGKSPSGQGGIWPHEQTFASGKEDRLNLMRATQAQLSPIFGIYRDPRKNVARLMTSAMEAGPATFGGITSDDDVMHSVWEVTDPAMIARFVEPLAAADIYIADGHHRYHTALNYRNQLAQGGDLAADHPANFCMFVLIAMEDPGMIVLPTHRVLGGMAGFSFDAFRDAAKGLLNITPFDGPDLAALEKALPHAGPHAIGLYIPKPNDAKPGQRLGTAPGSSLYIASTPTDDPLATTHAQHSLAWRKLDVAIVQHLLVERICQPRFAGGNEIKWKFPHALEQVEKDARSEGFQLGVIVQPTPLQSVMDVSDAGELMPQKSTFFYPKLATGLAINPLA